MPPIIATIKDCQPNGAKPELDMYFPREIVNRHAWKHKQHIELDLRDGSPWNATVGITSSNPPYVHRELTRGTETRKMPEWLLAQGLAHNAQVEIIEESANRFRWSRVLNVKKEEGKGSSLELTSMAFSASYHFMSRPLRIEFADAVYHVMNRGAARQPTFVDDGDYQTFLDTVAEAHRLWGIEVFAYSLMGNHYHLCVRTPRGNLSRVMRHVDGIYTQRFNRHHRRDGALFRGRYKAILIDADQYLAVVVRYIHLNAVEAGMVKMPEDYNWGSHRHYYRAKGVPRWLNMAEVVQQIGGRQAFHEFVLSGNEESLKRYYEARRHSPILGSEEFIERVIEPGAVVSREYARYERRVVQTAPERVIGEVGRQYKVTRQEILRGERGKENEARKVAMYLVKRCCDRRLAEMAEYFGTGSHSAVSWSCRQIEVKMAKDKKLRDRIERIAGSIHQLQT